MIIATGKNTLIKKVWLLIADIVTSAAPIKHVKQIL
jgi:hypothetical protein